jgi:Fe-S-cluster containining protein
VWLGKLDVARLAHYLGISTDEFIARYADEIPIPGQDRPGLSLKRVSFGCVFLNDATNECLVHAARPTQCRAFPFWPMALESPAAWQRYVGELCEPEALQQGQIYTVEEILAISSHLKPVCPAPPRNPP